MKNHDRQGRAALKAETSVSDDALADPTLNRAIQERIGTHLRALYDDLVQQPVPDRFVDLLNRLEGRKEKADQ